jgi:glycerol-3-phosphate cytidylyltransferase-like family protein
MTTYRDKVWSRTFDRLKKYKEKYGNADVPQNFNDDVASPKLGMWVTTQRRRYEEYIVDFPERIEMLNSIGFNWEMYSNDWNVTFDRLKRYKKTYGNADVPQNYNDDVANPKLGKWVMTQRNKHEEYIVDFPERIEMLNSIGFNWEIHALVDWNVTFSRLKKYKEKYGNADVPTKYNDDVASPKLGMWVSNQRKKHEEYIVDFPERIEMLNSIGFNWKINALVDWNVTFCRLKRYKEKYGNADVPQNYNDDVASPKLGIWVSNQRRMYEEYIVDFPERIEMLNSIGFNWEMYSLDWNVTFDRLKKYKEKYGNADVPQNFNDDVASPKLGIWVMTQRRRYEEYIVDFPERIEMLNSIGFNWEVYSLDWNVTFGRLKKYKEKYGNADVPQNFNDDVASPKLGMWVMTQRRRYEEYIVDFPERIEMLNSIGFNWETNALGDWNFTFGRLKRYKEKYGNADVPHNYNDDVASPKLGTWVSYHRRRYDEYTAYYPERIEMLNSIGFNWKANALVDWNVTFGRLKRYKEKYGNADVTQNYNDEVAGPKLGMWVMTQRRRYKEYIVDFPERIEMLNSIGFKWETYSLDWNVTFDRLKRYKETYGNADVPQNYNDDVASPKLGMWVKNQRRMYEDYIVDFPERIEMLNSIDFNWEVCTLVDWNVTFSRLKKYKEKYGNADVPRNYNDGVASPKLGIWVFNQRNKHEEYIVDFPERIEMLNSIGFNWEIHALVDWNVTFDRLKKYKEKYGNADVPHNYNDDVASPKLGTWVSNQRRRYEEYTVYYPERIEMLNSIGFNWEINALGDWNVTFSRLKKYKEKYGNADVPRNYNDGVASPKLGIWVFNQRNKHEEYIVDFPERIEMLNSIGFNWEISTLVDWNVTFDRLKKYKEKYGNADVPQNYIDDVASPKLGTWVMTQRRRYEEYIVDFPERIEMLNSIGLNWEIHALVDWNVTFSRLKKYKEIYGNADVPYNYNDDVAGPKLGIWVSNQRRLYEKYTVDFPERIEMLNSIGFNWRMKN